MANRGPRRMLFKTLVLATVSLTFLVDVQGGKAQADGEIVVVHSVAELSKALDQARLGKVRTVRLAAGSYPLAAPIVIDARLSGRSAPLSR